MRTIMAHLGTGENGGLYLVENWDIWPSGAHPPLWEAMRRGLGARQTIDHTPGHIFTSSEREDGLSIIILGCLFLWDAWFLTDTGFTAMYVSHDEFGVVYSVEGAELEDLESDLIHMKIETKSS